HIVLYYFFFSSRRRHTRCLSDWSSDVCSSDLVAHAPARRVRDHAHRIEVLPRRAGGDHDLLPQPRRALLEQPRRGGEHRLRLAHPAGPLARTFGEGPALRADEVPPAGGEGLHVIARRRV